MQLTTTTAIFGGAQPSYHAASAALTRPSIQVVVLEALRDVNETRNYTNQEEAVHGN
jgi:hypothetical protein